MKRGDALKMETVTLARVEDKLITIRGQSVLLDSDVATLYAVETREVNQAIQRNPDKFPEGYIVQLSKDEWESLRSQIVILNKKELVTNCDKSNRKHYPGAPKAFTEKGLYMLATILKGERAVQTTIAIVETFAKIRELARTVAQLAETKEKFKQQSLMQKSGEIMADILGEDMKTTDTETSIELNLAVLKFKHTVKRKPE
jgi:phage regulator Rha-like protein